MAVQSVSGSLIQIPLRAEINTSPQNITKYLPEGDYVIMLVSGENPVISGFQGL